MSQYANALVKCRQIDASATVTDTSEGQNNGEFKIEISNGKIDDFEVYLLNKKSYIKLKDGQSKNMAKGKYAIVVTGKTVDDDYCPKYLDITIR